MLFCYNHYTQVNKVVRFLFINILKCNISIQILMTSLGNFKQFAQSDALIAIFYFVPTDMGYYWISALGITAGAHRLWSHKSYKASLPLKVILACLSSMAYEVSMVIKKSFIVVYLIKSN